MRAATAGSLSHRRRLQGGRIDTAIALLDRSLQPAGVTIHELRLDPIWDPLRQDARFQRMLAKFGGKS